MKSVAVRNVWFVQHETLPQGLADFIAYRHNHLDGDEKGEAQVFLDRLFKAFGHGGVREAGATLEARVRKHEGKGVSFADLLWESRCIIEMKKAGTDLSKRSRQAFQYWIQVVPHRPRYVVICRPGRLFDAVHRVATRAAGAPTPRRESSARQRDHGARSGTAWTAPAR